MIEAKKIIAEPKLIDNCPNRYWILWDSSLGSKSNMALNKLQKAINLFSSKGWTVAHITSGGGVSGIIGIPASGSAVRVLYAVMENEKLVER